MICRAETDFIHNLLIVTNAGQGYVLWIEGKSSTDGCLLLHMVSGYGCFLLGWVNEMNACHVRI